MFKKLELQNPIFLIVLFHVQQIGVKMLSTFKLMDIQ